MEAEANQIRFAVDAVSRLTPDDSEDDLDHHCRWELRQLLDRVKMSELTPTEVISITVILARAHGRLLRQATHPADATVLRLVD